MGYYTGFKYKIRIHEEFEHFFLLLVKGDLEITDFPISYVSPRYLANWLDYLKTERNTWLVGGGSAYFDSDSWRTEYSLDGGVFYSSGSLKDYEDTIESFVKILPMFGTEFILIEATDDWEYENKPFEIYKSEGCTLKMDLI